MTQTSDKQTPLGAAELQAALLDNIFAEQSKVWPANQVGKRWEVYRSLVRAGIYSVVKSPFKRTFDLVPSFEALFATWLENDAPTTRIYRQLPNQFHAYLKREGLWPSEPAWIADLAQYEISFWDAGSAPEFKGEVGDVDFEKKLILHPSCAFLSLDATVHKEEIEMTPTYLAVFRQADRKISTWKLSKLGYHFLVSAIDATTLTEAAKQTQTKLGKEIDATFIDEISDALAKLTEAGAILGCGVC